MKTREQLEEDLLETLRQRQAEWKRASNDERDAARQRFIEALHAFNSLVLYNKLPEADFGRRQDTGKEGSPSGRMTTNA
jgi:hypothetical protein